MTLAWGMYLLLGALAGVLAGLLGVGGGLVLVAALVWLLPTQGIPDTLAVHVALATALGSILLTGLSSANAHRRRGSVLWATVRWLVPGLLLGGWLGSAVATRLEGDWLRCFIAVYCWLAALQLLLGWPRARPEAGDAPGGPAWSAIGGGSMTVPVLVWRGVRPVLAVGTSSACGVAIALASAAGYAFHGPAPGLLPAGSWGYVYLPAAAGIAIASVLTAPLGTRLAHALSGAALKRVFALFLAVAGSSVWLGG